ncbi:MAG: hypothetical protein KKH74_00720 [Gammaproteobacteria bacterium]|nr:hypothetical protein [Gammaproteobacteria bacterium]MBU1733373.1 hypothetical protein [Gammaproteobacteria bacterium]MBU1891790.1 hypothetical protein [Gammaproteobacteria bacterium]
MEVTMISMMDMTTGLWEKECTAQDVRFASGDFTPLPDAPEANPPLQGGLGEYVTARLPYAGMPVAMALQDMDDYLSRMDGSVA